MLNCNPATGVRYGVIACASLDPDLVDTLMYGPDANDLSYEEAYREAEAEAEKYVESVESEVTEEAHIEAAEIGADREAGFDLEAFTESRIEAMWERRGYADGDDYIDCKMQEFSSLFQCDEPTIEGVHDGVRYRIGWLGGAPLLWVLHGPMGYAKSLCSPCVPNAADLDSGFDGPFTSTPVDELGAFECYVVPHDWLMAKEAA